MAWQAGRLDSMPGQSGGQPGWSYLPGGDWRVPGACPGGAAPPPKPCPLSARLDQNLLDPALWTLTSIPFLPPLLNSLPSVFAPCLGSCCAQGYLQPRGCRMSWLLGSQSCLDPLAALDTVSPPSSLKCSPPFETTPCAWQHHRCPPKSLSGSLDSSPLSPHPRGAPPGHLVHPNTDHPKLFRGAFQSPA